MSLEDNTWVGFTGYRYHWSNNNKLTSDQISKIINQNNFKDHILKNIPQEWDDTDTVLGEEIFIDNWKLSKIFKHGGSFFLKNPKFFLKEIEILSCILIFFMDKIFLIKPLRF